MEQKSVLIAGIRFSRIGKIYHFDAGAFPDLKVGESVVVETSRGWQLGMVAQLLTNADPEIEGGLKSIDRRATPRDLVLRQSWQQKEALVVEACKQRAGQLNLVGVKVVGAEFSFEGSRLTINYSTESEERADLKSLRQDMQRMFSPSQVEMHQIGPRDVAKIMGGMGACGLETRCCSRFLTDFNSISIRMAKEQGISLTPTEITGMCGRLRCCLFYEYTQYVEARQHLPKRNKRVITPQGEGKVVDVFPLRQGVLVELAEQGFREFTIDQIEPADELESLQRKMQSPVPEGNCEECPKLEEKKEENRRFEPKKEERRREDRRRDEPRKQEANPEQASRQDRPRRPFRPKGEHKKQR